MATSPVQNLRIQFYGIQGSGSVFPSRADRLALQQRTQDELLARVFEDISHHADAAGRLSCRVEDLIGGPLTAETLSAYGRRFPVSESRVYGGWTTCVRIQTADGFDIVLDCGSGFRNCARDLQRGWGDRGERHLHLFGSHSHLDHTEGFDQAAVCFDPRNRLHIYGNHQFLRALDFNLGIFSHTVEQSVQGVQTPIFFGLMPAQFDATLLGPLPASAAGRPALHRATRELDTPIHLGATTITPFEVFHPAPCLAYRIERQGRVFVFCTDHELRHGDPAHPDFARSREAEARVVQYAARADVLYRDGQYLRAEYEGAQGIGGSAPAVRVGWGHSCIEDVVAMAEAGQVRHTLIGHHDPNREWVERDRLDDLLGERCTRDGARIEFARAETVIEL